MGLVDALIRKLPQLEAEESIQTANATAMGSGSLEQETARRLSDAWTRAANGGVRPKAPKANPAVLAAMGIGVRMVTKG